MDALGNRPAVQGFQRKSAQDQKIQSALRKVNSTVAQIVPLQLLQGRYLFTCRSARGNSYGENHSIFISENWCPKEDSNLHSLARTAT